MMRKGGDSRFSAHCVADGGLNAAAAGDTRPQNSFNYNSKQIVVDFSFSLLYLGFVFASLELPGLQKAQKSCEMKL